MPTITGNQLVRQTRWVGVTAFLVVFIVPSLWAQTTTPGPAIDIEIYNPVDGTNTFCMAPGEYFEAHIWVSPGSTSEMCSLTCGNVAGGTANLATAVIDIAYSGSMLSFIGAESNPDPGYAAVDGLIQDNSAEHRIGWALAGDWTPDGEAGGSLATPCDMQKLDQPGWVFRIGFIVNQGGTSELGLRSEPEFALSFADVCGQQAFTASNGGINEIVHGLVSNETPECAAMSNIIFRNGFESGSKMGWSH